MIRRSYSLTRLLVLVTLVAAFCGLAVNYPLLAFELVFGYGLFIPALMIALAMGRSSRHRIPMSFASMIAALCGYILFARLVAQTALAFIYPVTSTSPTLFALTWPLVWLIASTAPALPVIVLGGVWLLIEHRFFHSAR